MSRIDIYQNRIGNANAWDLPPWGHPLGQMVVPLFVRVDDCIIPVGTACMLSAHGLMISARHCVEEAFKYHRKGRAPLESGKKSCHLEDVSLCILHHAVGAGGSVSVTIAPVLHVNIPRPSDIAFLTIDWPSDVPAMTPMLSFALPRIGGDVISLGYTGFRFPSAGIAIGEVRDGTFDWRNDYAHQLVARIGPVRTLFTRRFAAGYIDGPCFAAETDLAHGQSGGPAFNADGNVCGVNSAGATSFFSKTMSLVSPLYFALGFAVRMRMTLAEGRFEMNVDEPLLSFVRKGLLRSDGSDRMHRFAIMEDGIRVDPLIHRDDCHAVFESFADYQNGINA